MPFSGDLATISLPSILHLLSNESKTGILHVKNTEKEFQIFYLDGAIIYAIESRKEARLNSLLIEAGVLTEAQIKECLDIAKKKKQALTKILIEKQYISPDTLERYIYKQVEEIISLLFTWEKGEFDYSDTKLSLKWLDTVKLNTLKLIVDGSRALDETSVVMNEYSDTGSPAKRKKVETKADKQILVTHGERQQKIFRLIEFLFHRSELTFTEIAEFLNNKRIMPFKGDEWSESVVNALYKQSSQT